MAPVASPQIPPAVLWDPFCACFDCSAAFQTVAGLHPGTSTTGRVTSLATGTPNAVASFNEMAGSIEALKDADIATRVSSDTAGQRLSFSLTGPTGPAAVSTIAGVHLKQIAQAGTTGPQATAGFLRIGGVNHDAHPVAVPVLAPKPVYSSWALNPVDDSAWTSVTLPVEAGILSA